jgi:DNA-binding phage protein
MTTRSLAPRSGGSHPRADSHAKIEQVDEAVLEDVLHDAEVEVVVSVNDDVAKAREVSKCACEL